MSCRLQSLLCSLFLLGLMGLSGPAQAGLFENQEQAGESLYQEGRYAEAADTFQDSYRRGVAQYRAGEYQKAARSFQQVEREEVRQAAKYNEGNSQFRAGNYEKAISAYDNVLIQNPEHEGANYNQNLARIMLAQATPEADVEKEEEQEKEEQKEQEQQQKEQQQKQESQQGEKDEESQQDEKGENDFSIDGMSNYPDDRDIRMIYDILPFPAPSRRTGAIPGRSLSCLLYRASPSWLSRRYCAAAPLESPLLPCL